jgi:threonine synthase
VQYISTRGGGTPRTFSETLLEGLAADGGLAVPADLPTISAAQLQEWRPLSYAALASEVIGLFATDIPRAELTDLCRAAYAPNVFASEVPLRAIDDRISLVGLSEGPTLAFKDMAMQFLGQALEYALERTGGVLNILGATSGDTGSAAEHALRGKERIGVFMLSPQGRMSDFQRAQMYSLQDDNIHNLAVEGVFDDCQDLVKELSGDPAFRRAHHLGAVNSINLARITAQIVYYVWAWLRATDDQQAQEVSFAVPTGNFGNILSGHYAKQMGLPIRQLVLATNENNVLDEFFRTGVYRPRSAQETPSTSSPSMDISRASNFERFVYDLLGRDPQRVQACWSELSSTGAIDLSDHQERFASEFGFVSGTSTHRDRLDTIRGLYGATGDIIDPHTADGVKVARQYASDDVPMLVLETAKPQKFAETIDEAIGVEVELTPALRTMMAAEQQVTSIPASAEVLRDVIEQHAVEARS